jgi:hypothetical protein
MSESGESPGICIALANNERDAGDLQERLGNFGIETFLTFAPPDNRGNSVVELRVHESEASRARWILAAYPTFPKVFDPPGRFPWLRMPLSGSVAVERARARHFSERQPVLPSRIALVLLGIAFTALLLFAILTELLG